MTDDQKKCWRLLCDLFGGSHHIFTEPKPCAEGIELCVTDTMTTTDSSNLTRFVLLCHDRGIRGGISAASSHYIRMQLWARKTRQGRLSEKHPTMETSISLFRRPDDDDMGDV
jgi:hypothetical protein